MGPPDGILGLVEAFTKDDFPKKVNLSVGAYRGDDGKPWVLPSVRKAEERVVAASMNKEYAPIAGVDAFVTPARGLLLASTRRLWPMAASLRYSRYPALVHAVSSAISTTSSSVMEHLFYLPSPSWGNHANIFKASGLDVRSYRYWDAATNGLDLDGMIADLLAAPDGSAVLLHACAHNPTGVDPTPEQWEKVCAALKPRIGKGLHVFFDSAYQGFASGDAERDAFAIRHFADNGVPFALRNHSPRTLASMGSAWACSP